MPILVIFRSGCANPRHCCCSCLYCSRRYYHPHFIIIPLPFSSPTPSHPPRSASRSRPVAHHWILLSSCWRYKISIWGRISWQYSVALRYLTKCTYEVTFNDWGRVVLVSTFSTLLYRSVAIHTNGSLLVASSDYCNFASSYQSSLSILHSIPKWLLGEDMPLSVRSVAVLHTKSKSLLLRTSSFLFRKSRSSPGFVFRQHLGPKNHLDFFC